MVATPLSVSNNMDFLDYFDRTPATSIPRSSAHTDRLNSGAKLTLPRNRWRGTQQTREHNNKFISIYIINSS